MITPGDLQKRFVYHPPFGDQPVRYEAIRSKALEFARFLIEQTAESREQSLAITALEEVVFWANASIARHERK